MNISSLSETCVASPADYRCLIDYLDQHVGRPMFCVAVRLIDGRKPFVKKFSYPVLRSIIDKRSKRFDSRYRPNYIHDLHERRIIQLHLLLASTVTLAIHRGVITTSYLSYVYHGQPKFCKDSVVVKTYLRYVGII